MVCLLHRLFPFLYIIKILLTLVFKGVNMIYVGNLGHLPNNEKCEAHSVSAVLKILYPWTGFTAWKLSKYGVLLVRIFLYSDWIQGNTGHKKLLLWELYTQCLLILCRIGGGKKVPPHYQFFPCSFYKRTNSYPLHLWKATKSPILNRISMMASICLMLFWQISKYA